MSRNRKFQDQKFIDSLQYCRKIDLTIESNPENSSKLKIELADSAANLLKQIIINQIKSTSPQFSANTRAHAGGVLPSQYRKLTSVFKSLKINVKESLFQPEQLRRAAVIKYEPEKFHCREASRFDVRENYTKRCRMHGIDDQCFLEESNMNPSGFHDDVYCPYHKTADQCFLMWEYCSNHKRYDDCMIESDDETNDSDDSYEESEDQNDDEYDDEYENNDYEDGYDEIDYNNHDIHNGFYYQEDSEESE